MTTLASQNIIPEQASKLALVKGGGSSSANSGSITQGGMNPSSAAMLILYEVMGMYSYITGVNAEEQKTQISAQQSMGKAGAHATESAGKWAGLMAALGAATALMGTFANLFVSLRPSGEIKNNNNAVAKLEADIAPAKNLDTLDREIEPNKTLSTKSLGIRAKQIMDGSYKTSDAAADRQAIEQIKKSPEDYKLFRKRLDENLGNFEKARNTKATDSQILWQKHNQIGQVATQLGSASNSAAQGTGQLLRAKEEAKAALQNSAMSMAQQTASSQADAARKSGEAQNAVVHVLNAIRQASSNV